MLSGVLRSFTLLLVSRGPLLRRLLDASLRSGAGFILRLFYLPTLIESSSGHQHPILPSQVALPFYRYYLERGRRSAAMELL